MAPKSAKSPAAASKKTLKSPAGTKAARKTTPAAAAKASPGRGPLGPTPSPRVPAGPSSHELAVAAFERGFQALHARQFGQATKFLASVVNDYPDEKELQERARVYLNICERQQAAERRRPQSVEERVNEATVALNRGETEAALGILRKLETERGDHDHVQYMLCVTYTALGAFPQALDHLKKAIALNHENRYLASQDVDLDPLRRDPGFAAVHDAPSGRPKPADKRS